MNFRSVGTQTIFCLDLLSENPGNEFHVNGKYINSSAVSAEVYHVVSRQRITDALMTVRLNNSYLLHSRIHWRPELVNDVKVFRY